MGLCLPFVPAVFATGEESDEIPAPPWKMALLKKNASGYESVPFRRPLSMTRRDAYQLYLAFEGNASCYVIQEDDEGGLPVIFRKNVSNGDTLSLPGECALEGSEANDFICSALPGTSRLYIVVSAQPKQNLERFMEQRGRGPAAPSLERSILSEVLAIRRSASSAERDSGPERLRRRSPENNDRPDPSDPTEARGPITVTDPAINGELSLFEGRETWVVTVTVRVQ